MSGRQRLDEAVTGRGLAETRSRARALILAGDVVVNGQIVDRAGAAARPDDVIELRAKPRFVSRGGEKLAHALAVFAIDPAGWTAADIGASTGGFTDCLLQAGAAKVYAIDVGYGQLAERIRRDPRVEVMERRNIRFLTELPEAIDLAVIDVSFISLKLVFPVVVQLLRECGECVALIKPQFEAGRRDVGHGGVVRDPAVHRRVLIESLTAAQENGLGVRGLTRSPLLGPAGNVEFLAHLVKDAASLAPERLIAAVVPEERAADGE